MLVSSLVGGMGEYCVNKTSFGTEETGGVCVPVMDDHEDDTMIAVEHGISSYCLTHFTSILIFIWR